MGNEEKCCGDPARRAGNEYLFQMMAEENVQSFKQYKFKKIVTTCPHGYHMLKNEYPEFDGEFEVIHHSELIHELIQSGQLELPDSNGKEIVIHDSCYLGRYKHIYQEPREILKAIDGLKNSELARCRENSFCYGGGGGHLWMEENSDQRVNERRVQEIIDSDVEIVATACPYCLTMVEDGLKSRETDQSIKTMDLSELIAELLEKNT